MDGRILSAFKVGNFKAFADTQTISLKPITLIFGPNSAGKSSFIQSLALAHEGLRTGKLDIFRTDIGGSAIDLGGFRQYVHKTERARRVEWGAEIDTAYPTSRLVEAVAQSDAAVVTLPGTPLTEKLFSRVAIGTMKRDAVFGSVGRGTVVDQDALIEALRSGAIAGAVLDVFTPEPLPADNPLWTMQNVIFSPHTAALSVLENARITELFCDNLERFASGRPLRNAVNTTEFY